MIYLMIVQILLLIHHLYVSRKFYDDGDYEDRIKFPIWLYLIYTILSLIPIVGLLTEIVFIIAIVKALIEEDFYYKPGKITKFLIKEV